MNHAIVLAMLPLPLLAWASWPQEQSVELVARTVQSEGIRAQRQDTETFAARWRPVYLAPMRNEVRAGSELFAPAVYRTEPVQEPVAEPVPVGDRGDTAAGPLGAARSTTRRQWHLRATRA